MLHESQEEIKELRSRCGPAAHLCFSQSYGGVFTGVRGEEAAMRLEEGERRGLHCLQRVWIVMP